jgi:hypothetical protein
MASFKKYADDFKTRWFGRDEASLQDIAAEYWSIVDKGDKHVGVCYGSGVYRAAPVNHVAFFLWTWRDGSA